MADASGAGRAAGRDDTPGGVLRDLERIALEGEARGAPPQAVTLWCGSADGAPPQAGDLWCASAPPPGYDPSLSAAAGVGAMSLGATLDPPNPTGGSAAAAAPTAGGKRRGKRARGKKAAHPRSPWPGPTKQSAFVFLFWEGEVYAVRDTAGKIGVPGGKRDPGDATIWRTLQREFREETGGALPAGAFPHFEWGDARHTIRVYHRLLTREEARALHVGEVADPGGSEAETLWAAWEGMAREGFRPHIARALKLYGALPPEARNPPTKAPGRHP